MSLAIDYHNFKVRVKGLIKENSLINDVAQELIKQGKHVFLVGGTVRDIFLNTPIKDIDIEVHGVSLGQLLEVLKQFGPVDLVGKSFGVLKVFHTPIDWSIPRIDTAGRKPDVTLIPDLSIHEAFSRRDLTINAMAIDLKTLGLVDPFHGLQDLKDGILRTPDKKKFIDDPLRFYRVMQFIGRFNMHPDNELEDICKYMNIQDVSIERIEVEFEKLYLKSIRPSLGFRWLKEIGRLHEIVPELAQTIGVRQSVLYHPEGDVFEHSMQATDAAADYSYKDDREKLTIILAALCHDLGKVETTVIRNDGRITSYRHEEFGVPLSKTMLKRMTTKRKLIDTVCILVRYHMEPGIFVRHDAGLKAYKRLAGKLVPLANLRLLGLVALADRRGRNGLDSLPLAVDDAIIMTYFNRAREAMVEEEPEPPLLKGRDLLDTFKPGPLLGRALDYAYELQIDQEINDKEELKKLVLEKFST